MSNKALVTRLLSLRADNVAQLDQILIAPNRQNRNLTPLEEKRFNALAAEIRAQDARLNELSAVDDADAEHGQAVRNILGGSGLAGGYTQPRDGEIYQRGNPQVSFFRDVYAAKFSADRGAMERLDQNRQIVADAHAEQRAISTTTGTGGELVPPLWMENEFVKFVRPGRITANLATPGPVPPGTDVINIPKANTGTATAVQTTQNTGVQQTDMTTTSVSTPVITIAGGQTVALQLIEQSPTNVDDIILEDLADDYAKQWDLQVLQGTGSSGQVTGLTVVSGINSITWTQATPGFSGPGGLNSKIASAISTVNSTRFMPPTAIVMHPRRWGWITAQTDGNGRPLVLPDANGPMNAAGLQDAPIAAEGRVGVIQGLPVYTDANIATNQGTGTNQDYILIMRASDLRAYEGSIRAEAFQQTYANQLSVLVRLYNYGGFIANRHPTAISVISGTGLVTPAF